ncbi:RteC domain-containing protein [Pedobacter rhizosphaerae]|uniref:RteC protein n=1 Tax=Pedobacter rhizosphaerae TaxID=390241 RepID=A0A1H9T0G9_9SPHI|nr:RteC domain-containing protein [Pedobacter rhizosphaerae]SER90123.1 RteC protein [Pedobacter rhizosphaerae]
MYLKFSEKLLAELDIRLESLAVQEFSDVARLKARTALIADAIGVLSDFVSEHPSEDSLEEILYYKTIYPRFKSLIVFETAYQYFLVDVPDSGLKAKKKYCLLKLREIARFFEQNSMHYDYFRLDGEMLDELFYTRNDAGNVLQPFVLAYEPFLGTPMAELVSSFVAFERLRNEILALLHALSGPASLSATVVDAAGSLQRQFKWTGEDIHLIELAHGIHLTGQVNNGAIGIVELFKIVGEFFGVNLRVPKRGFDDLKARKTMSKTAFLDMMKAAMLKKMEDDDAYDPEKLRRRNGF